MMTKILAVLTLAAFPLHSMAHNQYSLGSTDIEFYELELSPAETIKLKHLKIYSEDEHHEGVGTTDNALPALPQQINDDISLTPV